MHNKSGQLVITLEEPEADPNQGGDTGNTGGDGDNTGGDGDNTGGDTGNTGGDNTGGDNTGGDNPDDKAPDVPKDSAVQVLASVATVLASATMLSF